MRINAIGAYFEKILSGFTFGTQTDQITVTGSLDFEASLSPGFEYTFPDKTGVIALIDDINYLTGATFNTGDGVISLNMLTGDTVTVDIDGRYALTSDLVANTDDFTTGATFNTGDGVITYTRQSGSTYNVDIDGRYSLTSHGHDFSGDYLPLSGGTMDNTNLVTNLNADLLDSQTGSYYLDYGNFTNTPTILNEDDYVTGATFNTGDGVITFTRQSGSTFNVDIDGRYITSAIANTDDFTTGATFNTSDGVLEFTRQSGSTYNIDLDGRYSLDLHTHNYLPLSGGTMDNTNLVTNLNADQLDSQTGSYYLDYGNFTNTPTILNEDDYVSSAGFNTGDGVLTLTRLSGGTVTQDLDGRYLLSSDYTPSDANTDDFTTGATFNTGDGVITYTRQSGSTYNVDIDGRYMTSIGVGAGLLSSGGLAPNLNLALSALTDGTGAIVGAEDEIIYLDNGIQKRKQVDEWDLSTFNNDLPSVSNTDDYITGATFNTGDGVITHTLQSGGTVTVDIDGRYVTSVVGGTGVSSSGGLTPSIALTVDELAEKSGDLVGSDRLVGTTSTTNWAETISNIPLSIFNDDLGYSVPNDATITLSAGTGLSTGGAFTTDQSGNETITFNIDYLGTDSFIGAATNLHGTPIATIDSIVYSDVNDSNVKKGLVSDLPFNNNTYTATLTAGSGIAGTTYDPSTSTTFSLDLSELGVTTLTGSDWLAFDDAGTSSKALISTIPLSVFNNDLSGVANTDDYITGATFNTGDGVITHTLQSGSTVTVDIDGRYLESIGVGAGLLSSGGLSPNLNLALSALTDMGATNMVGTDEFIVLDNGVQKRKIMNDIQLSLFDDDLTYGTIGGSIAANQIAVGSGPDTISGSTNLTWNSSTLEVSEGTILVSGASTTHGFELRRAGLDSYSLSHLDGGLTVYNVTDARKEMTFDGAGFIGIRESSPDATLHVNSLSNDLVSKFESTDSIAYIQLLDSADSVYLSTESNWGYLGGQVGNNALNLGVDLASGVINIGTAPTDAGASDEILRITSGGDIVGSSTAELLGDLGVAGTDITVVEAATTVDIQSSTGTNDTIAGATASLAGVVTNTTQTFAGAKTFTGNIIAQAAINSFTSLTSVTNATKPVLVLDSIGSGDNWTAQGAAIYIGENASSGDAGSAKASMTYVGNGKAYFGAGVVTAGVPVQYIQFDYQGTGAITTNDDFTVTGTMAATTVTGANVTSGVDPGHTHSIYGTGDGIVESLTTTGTSGASTLIGGVLNIPNYANDNDNFYLTGLSYASATSILTATVSGASNPTVDLSNAIYADALAVTGNGTTAQYLRSDADGTFSWDTPTTITGNAGSATQIYVTSDDTGDTNNPILFANSGGDGNRSVYEDSTFYFDNTNNVVFAPKVWTTDYVMVDGTNPYIEIDNSTSGSVNFYMRNTEGGVRLSADGDNFYIYQTDVDTGTVENTWANFINNGAVNLYYNGAAKISTASGGVTVTGTMAATTVTGANVTSGVDPGHTHSIYGTGDGTILGSIADNQIAVGTAADTIGGSSTFTNDGDLLTFQVNNTLSNATTGLELEQLGLGDNKVMWNSTSSQNWSMGSDYSIDSFVLSRGVNFTTPVFTVDGASEAVVFSNNITALSLFIEDTDSAFLTRIRSTSTNTANRALTIDMNDAARTLAFTGDATISGTNTGDGTYGIANTNYVQIDSASVADNEYARFTANGLESRSNAEVLADIGAGTGDGTVTSVTAGAGMTQTGTSTINPTLNVIGGIGITANANDIEIDFATTTVRGGIELEDAAVQTTAANTVTTTASRTYGLQLNSSGQGVINVPWTDNNDNDIDYINSASWNSSTGLLTLGGVGNAGATAAVANLETYLNANLNFGSGDGDMLLGTIQTVTAAKTFNNGTLLLDDSDSAFDLVLASTSTITSANKTLTFDVNNADRTLTVSGNATVSGTNTGDGTYGIANTNYVQINSSTVADNEYARFTASGLESRSNAEVLADIGAQAAGTYVTAVTGGDGILSSGGVTPDIDLNYSGAGNFMLIAPTDADVKASDYIIYQDTTDSEVYKALVSSLPFGTGTMSSFTLDGDTGTPQTIEDGNTLTINGGNGIEAVVGEATDTISINLSAATATGRGGIELESDTVQTTAANAVTSTASRTYGLQVNSSGQGVINVPWTDSGGIGGSAVSTRVAYGSGTDTITSDASFTYASAGCDLTVGSTGEATPSIIISKLTSGTGKLSFLDGGAEDAFISLGSTEILTIDCDTVIALQAGTSITADANIELDQASIKLEPSPTNNTGQGIIVSLTTNGLIGVTAGDTVYLTGTDIISVGSSVNADPIIGIALDSVGASTAVDVLLMGICEFDVFPTGLAGGDIIYASTSGNITETAPVSGYVQVLGVAMKDDKIYFNPSMNIIDL